MRVFLFAALLLFSAGCGYEERFSDVEYDADRSMARAIEAHDKISDLKRSVENLESEINHLRMRIGALEKKE